MAKFNITVDLAWLDEEGNIDQQLKDEILSSITEKVCGNITKSLEEKAEKILNDKMRDVENEVNKRLNLMMQQFFNTPKDITDRWGEVTRAQVTVKQLLSEACDNYLTQPVTREGKPDNGYNPAFKSRVDYIVHKSIDSDMEWQIKRAVEDVTKNLKQKISTEISTQLGEKLAGIIGIDKIISK